MLRIQPTRTFLLMLLVQAALVCSEQTVEPGREYIYKESYGHPQALEVYFPPGHDASRAKVPGVVLFHGGGWVRGDLEQFRYACRYLASRGLVAATANYYMKNAADVAAHPELKKQSTQGVCVTDAKSAIRWMKAHAGELGVDPTRIVTGGGSAGGHISLLAAVSTNAELDDPADPKGIDTSVVAYLLFNPAIKTSARPQPTDAGTHLTADTPPMLVFFGTKDTWYTRWQVYQKKVDALDLGDSFQLFLAPDQNHGFMNTAPWQDLTLIEADRFLVSLGLLDGKSTLSHSGQERLQRAAP